MLRFVFFFIILMGLQVKLWAQEDENLEDRIMGVVELNEEEILAPLTAEDKKYLDALKSKTKVDPDLKDARFPEIDFKEINELTDKRKKSIHKIIRSAGAKDLTYAEKEALEVQLTDILKSGTFLATIKQGTQLVHIRTGKLFYVPKDIVVRAFRLKDYEGYQLIQNNNGYVSYKAPSTEVINIKEITTLYEKPRYYKPVVKKITYDINDKKFKYQTNFMVHAGVSRPVFIRDLVNSPNHFGQSIRYEATAYGDWNFPVKTGLTGQWENNFGNYETGKYNIQTLSFGPSFKTPNFKLLGSKYQFIAQTRLALFSRISVVDNNRTSSYRASQTNLSLGLVKSYKTVLGSLLLGVNYQRQWVKAAAQNFALDIGSTNNYNDIFSVSIGHGADWIW